MAEKSSDGDAGWVPNSCHDGDAGWVPNSCHVGDAGWVPNSCHDGDAVWVPNSCHDGDAGWVPNSCHDGDAVCVLNSCHVGDAVCVPNSCHDGDAVCVPNSCHGGDAGRVPNSCHDGDAGRVPNSCHDGDAGRVPNSCHDGDAGRVPSSCHDGDAGRVPNSCHDGDASRVPNSCHDGDAGRVANSCHDGDAGCVPNSCHGSICEDEEAAAGVQFFPPLYMQRYSLTLKVLMEQNIRSVIDFGCSECNFVRLLPTVPTLERVALVDIDRDLLVSKKWKIKPELYHYFIRRSAPLHVVLFAGNAEDTDSRLLDYEAVTLIEVIEHLQPEVLQNVTQNVFGNVTPRLCVVTTPNSEFNVLFNNKDPKQFRHSDHKFEWTRQEFHQWCDKICDTYGYSVEYSGVGRLPSSDNLGPCSQAAIFTLRDRVSPSSQVVGMVCYELIAESDFPYEKDVLSLEEKIDLEVSYCLRQMLTSQQDDHIPGQPINIPISSLAKFHTVKALCDENGVRESLGRSIHRVSSDGLFVVCSEDEELDEELDEDALDGESGTDDVRDVESEALWELSGSRHQKAGGGLYSEDKVVAEENWDT